MISAAAGTLSVLGSLFIIVTFHIIYGVGRSGRRSGAVPVSTRIVYWISISDIVVSLCYIMPAGEMALADRTNCGDFRCLLLAAMSQFFTLVRLVPASTFGSHCPLSHRAACLQAGILWAAMLAYNIQLKVLHPASSRGERRLLIGMHGVCWATSGAVLLPIAASGALGTLPGQLPNCYCCRCQDAATISQSRPFPPR